MTEEEIIQQRMPVWGAISELALDSKCSSDTFERVVEICKNSTYSLRELKKIYAYEVMPAIGSFSDFWTGVESWAGYDAKWLSNIILTYTDRKYIKNIATTPSLIEKLKSKWFTLTTKKNWARVIEKLESLRKSSDHPSNCTA